MRFSGLTLRDLIHAQRPSRKVSSLMGMDPQRQSRILPGFGGKNWLPSLPLQRALDGA
jgi:hypothetical protein